MRPNLKQNKRKLSRVRADQFRRPRDKKFPAGVAIYTTDDRSLGQQEIFVPYACLPLSNNPVSISSQRICPLVIWHSWTRAVCLKWSDFSLVVIKLSKFSRPSLVSMPSHSAYQRYKRPIRQVHRN